MQGKLANERFVANAPEEVVAQERAKEADYLDKQKAVQERIENCVRFNNLFIESRQQANHRYSYGTLAVANYRSNYLLSNYPISSYPIYRGKNS